MSGFVPTPRGRTHVPRRGCPSGVGSGCSSVTCSVTTGRSCSGSLVEVLVEEVYNPQVGPRPFLSHNLPTLPRNENSRSGEGSVSPELV